MRLRLTAVAFVGAAILFVLPSWATDEKRLIDVVAQPTADFFRPHTDVTVKVTITNSANYEVWFMTCPDPYTVSLEDAHGPVALRKHEPPPQKDDELIPPGSIVNIPICTRNLLVVIKPGESSHGQISLSDLYDLDAPGSYTGRVTWRFDSSEVASDPFHITIRSKPQD
jgi:hypothetical protein